MKILENGGSLTVMGRKREEEVSQLISATGKCRKT